MGTGAGVLIRPDSSKSDPPSIWSPCPPRLSHPHSHDPIAFPAPSPLRRPLAQENSLSEQGRGLGEGQGETGPRRVGIGTQPQRHLSPCRAVSHLSLHPWGSQWIGMMTKMPNPSWASQLAALLGPAGPRAHSHLALWDRYERRAWILALPSEQTVCGEGWGGTRPPRQAPRFRERPVKDDGLAHSTGTGGLWGSGRDVSGHGHVKHLPLQPRGQCENGEKHEMR